MDLRAAQMMGPSLFGTVAKKLQKGFRRADLPLGGIPLLILYGDDAQLPPVGQQPLFDRSATEKKEVAKYGKLTYLSISRAVYLRQMVRQRAAPCRACPSTGPNGHAPGELCNFFPDLLHRMRFEHVSHSDWEWMMHRHIRDMDPAEAHAFRSSGSLWLVPTRVLQHNMNLDRLEGHHTNLRTDRGLPYAWICPLTARNSGRAATRAARQIEDFAGLPAQTWLCRGAPVVMTTNVCQSWQLFNGAVGRVVDIVFRPGESPRLDGTSWPHMVIVEFPKYTGPLVFPDRPKVISNTEPAVTCLQSVFCKTLL